MKLLRTTALTVALTAIAVPSLTSSARAWHQHYGYGYPGGFGYGYIGAYGYGDSTDCSYPAYGYGYGTGYRYWTYEGH